MQKIIKLIAIFFLVVPSISSAQIIISEIMYDVEGTDSKREWIEVKNIGTQSVDLSTYKLFENNSNHSLTFFSGESILNSGAYAIIASDPESWLLDWPDFDGSLFDSVFSLSNSGEELVINNSSGSEEFNISYNPDLGAKGTGNSLQYQEESQILIPASPTPGAENMTEPADESADKDSDSSSSSGNSDSVSSGTSSHESQAEISDEKVSKPLKIGAGRNRLGSINTDISFKAILDKDSKKGRIEYFWTMGDGRMEKGDEIEHTYYYPGEYNVILNAYTNDEIATARTKVKIIEPKIEIILNTNYELIISNKSESEINIGGFKIENIGQRKQEFTFPRDTILSKGQSLTISAKITDFDFVFGVINLNFPNNELIQSIDVLYDPENPKSQEMLNNMVGIN